VTSGVAREDHPRRDTGVSDDIVFFDTFESPIGPLTAAATDAGLTALLFETHRHGPSGAETARWRAARASGAPAARVLEAARAQLDAYFAGTRTTFDLPLAPRGTPFQHRVWRALRDIPYGETVSYAEVARRIGAPDAVRAVGAANGRNPVSIVVPCHRVIGADGALTGYGGGIERKRWLLAHEGWRGAEAPSLFDRAADR
jgi:methylated-DNA-[protein]-cysteine S-methyltransferase